MYLFHLYRSPLTKVLPLMHAWVLRLKISVDSRRWMQRSHLKPACLHQCAERAKPGPKEAKKKLVPILRRN